MGRVVPPNWGRSFPMKSLLGAEHEFVRVDLPEASDLTIVMGNPESMQFDLSPRPLIMVDFGQGATTMQMVLDPRTLGRVMHVVTKTLVVRAKLEPSEVGTPDATYSIVAGRGRPKDERITSRLYIHDAPVPRAPQPDIGYGNFLLLEPWVYAVSIIPWNVSEESTPAVLNLNVQQGTYDKRQESWGDIELGTKLGDYATPRPIDPSANIILIEKDDVGRNYLVQQYRQL